MTAPLGTSTQHDSPETMTVAVRRLWLVVLLFALVMVAWSVRRGIPPRDPHGAIFITRIGLSLTILVVLVMIDGWWRARREHNGTILESVRARWTRSRLLLVGGALLAYHLVYFSYHNLKSWDVFNAPRDDMLLRWDRVLFLGHSPAVLLHDLLGEHVAAYVLMVIYESFSTLVAVAVVAAVVFPERIRDSYVFIASGVWVWILGTASYYLIPSLGPFDSAPEEFSGLPHTMIQDTQARYMDQRAHLLAHPHAGDAFAQVSAFASLHIGVSSLLLLMAHYYGMRRATWVLGVYVALTAVATVYLGWHFFVDDIAGFAIAVLAVRLGRWIVYPGGRGETPKEQRLGRSRLVTPSG